MINKILLLSSIILIIITYLYLIILKIKSKKIFTNNNGFDFIKELTLNYNEINIVESKEINISKYNLKRNVIRLTKKDYTSNDLFTLSKLSLLAGYSLLNINNDNNINLLKKVFTNIDYLNKSSIIAIIISTLSKTKLDAKIAIILLIIILIYQYLLNEININSKDITKEQITNILEDSNYNNLEKIQNILLFINKISFITTLILLLREILIIIN